MAEPHLAAQEECKQKTPNKTKTWKYEGEGVVEGQGHGKVPGVQKQNGRFFFLNIVASVNPKPLSH